jgi:hypothetical protein
VEFISLTGIELIVEDCGPSIPLSLTTSTTSIMLCVDCVDNKKEFGDLYIYFLFFDYYLYCYSRVTISVIMSV